MKTILGGLVLTLVMATSASAQQYRALYRHTPTITPVERCPILLPDLTITNMTGFGTTARVTVANIGQVKSKTVTLELKAYQPTGYGSYYSVVRYASVPPVAPGRSVTISINTGSVLMTGGVRLEGFVDADYSMGELNELNNKAFTVLAGYFAY